MTLQPYEPSHTPALINPATDSWTAVLAPVIDLATNIANTDFVPKDMRGNIPKVVAAILHSRELGLPPMTGLAGSHVIGGRPGISAELMRSLIEQAGHELRITEMTSSRCVMKGRRKGWQGDEWTTVTYAMEEAIRSGDAKKNPNYSTRPAEMLLARCTTRLARMIFADVIHGMRSVEELQDMTEDSDGVMLPIAQETAKVQRRAPKPALAPAPEPAPQAARPPAPTPVDGQEGVAVEEGEADTATPARVEAQEPPARRRPPLTRRGAATAPAGDVVDAEVVEDAPVPDVEPAAPAPARPAGLEEARKAARQKMTSVLMQHWARLEVTARDERLWCTGILVGRDVASTNDLTPEELRQLVVSLERMRNRAALDARCFPVAGQ